MDFWEDFADRQGKLQGDDHGGGVLARREELGQQAGGQLGQEFVRREADGLRWAVD